MYAAILADDLTGACDAGVQFRMRGAKTLATAAPDVPVQNDSDVLAVNCETRELGEREREIRLRQIASNVERCTPQLVFKKIDSTMRGHPGSEIITTMDAFHRDIAVITPAFPEMGRIVSEGYLQLNAAPTWTPFEVAALLRAQGLTACSHVRPPAVDTAVAQGHRYISVDATCREDLELIAQATLPLKERILWTGSAGLASALAAASLPAPSRRSAPPPSLLPVLFIIGSNHAATTAQVSAVTREFSSPIIDADKTTPDQVLENLESGQHLIVTLYSQISAGRVQHLFRCVRPRVSALLLSGGATASVFCRALSITAIELEDEIVAGVPWGFLRGGPFHGVPVATKSGAFGDCRALIQIAEFFTCPNG